MATTSRRKLAKIKVQRVSCLQLQISQGVLTFLLSLDYYSNKYVDVDKFSLLQAF